MDQILFFVVFRNIAQDRLFSSTVPTHRHDAHRNFLMIPSYNRIKISAKGDTYALLGVKGLKFKGRVRMQVSELILWINDGLILRILFKKKD